MGSDKLFQRRKTKAAEKLRRKKAKRSPYSKVLIVCEGEKTEPNYFNGLIDFYELNSANVAVDGDCGSSPKSILQRAINLYEEEDRKGDAFDRVYCVFDKDTHDSYEETMRAILLQQPSGSFFAAASVPCFEYWLLLHFSYTTKPYVATGSSSVGDEVLKDLKKVMSEYTKGQSGLFALLSTRLEEAKTHAARALKHAKDNRTDNPSTSVHELVAFLQGIKSE